MSSLKINLSKNKKKGKNSPDRESAFIIVCKIARYSYILLYT
jgi:hypothetical protein